MSIIRLRSVTKRFRRELALDAVDLAVEAPQVVGLIGRNGAGKSTLLRLLPPLIHPTSGTVTVFDLDPWDHQEQVKSRLGYVSDQDRIPFGVRVRDLFELCAVSFPSWDETLVERFCSRLALNRRAAFNQLSQGQQRQVSLLCAIGHRPELLLLDEPAANFDVAVRREFMSVVIELLAETGSTVLMATHLLADLERLAERLLIIHHGRLRYDGALDALKQGLCRVEFAPGTVTPDALRASPLCLQTQSLGDGLQAVLDCAPEQAASRLLSSVGERAVPTAVAALTLEDAFIHRTADERHAEAR